MDSTSYDVQLDELTLNGTSYTSEGFPTVGFVVSTVSQPTTSDTTVSPTEMAQGGSPYSGVLTSASAGTKYIRAYISYGLGTFYSQTEEQALVQPFTFTFARRTTTDLSDPPNYIEGEPKSPTPSASDGEVYFDLEFTGKMSDITETGIVSGTSANPTTANDVLVLTAGTNDYGAAITVPVGPRYFRGYNILNATETVYSSQVEFTMEDVRGSVSAEYQGVMPPLTVTVTMNGQIYDPSANPSSAGFDWTAWTLGDVEPNPEDPYYGTSNNTVTIQNVSAPAGPGSPWTFAYAFSGSAFPDENRIRVRPWAIINGIKYWGPLISVNY
jgi:hypothetical protein